MNVCRTKKCLKLLLLASLPLLTMYVYVNVTDALRSYWHSARIFSSGFTGPKGGDSETKTILLLGEITSWKKPRGSSLFKEEGCAVGDCELVDDPSLLSSAHVVYSKFEEREKRLIDRVWEFFSFVSPVKRSFQQIWALFLHESPYHSPSFSKCRGAFNWTISYRRDATIFLPYGTYIPINSSRVTRAPVRNFARGKTKKVAWFVSHCVTPNRREEYVDQLSKHIQVDVYGACGPLTCPRSQEDHCFAMLDTHYKFYLALENSNCKDYITEKFFTNGLQHDVIPIVMGAAPDEYRRVAPPHSYIHVDDFRSPRELAEYLHRLDSNDTLYNQYFAWKGLWTAVRKPVWCEMCSLAHQVERGAHTWYDDVETWWRGPGVCIGSGRWRNTLNSTGH